MFLLYHVYYALMHLLESFFLLFDPHHGLLVSVEDNVLNHLEVLCKLLLKETLLLVKLSFKLHKQRLKRSHSCVLLFARLSTCLFQSKHLTKSCFTLLSLSRIHLLHLRFYLLFCCFYFLN